VPCPDKKGYHKVMPGPLAFVRHVNFISSAHELTLGPMDLYGAPPRSLMKRGALHSEGAVQS